MKRVWMPVCFLMMAVMISPAAIGYNNVEINKSTAIREGEIYDSIYMQDSVSDIGDVIQTVVQFNGLWAGIIYCVDGSRLEVNEGSGLRIYMTDESSLSFGGGYFETIYGGGNSRLEIHGSPGESCYLTLEDSCQMNYYDGPAYSLLCFGESAGTMHSGFIYHSVVNDSSRFSLAGGTVCFMAVIGQSEAHFYGGEIEDGLVAEESGEIHLYGSGFIYDASGGNYNGGLISGLWRDQTPFSISLIDQTYNHLVFHEIPEPATLLLLSIGWICLRRSRWSSDFYMPKGIST